MILSIGRARQLMAKFFPITMQTNTNQCLDTIMNDDKPCTRASRLNLFQSSKGRQDQQTIKNYINSLDVTLK